MRKKKSLITPTPDSEMPTSAMIDVVFLILIYFVITYKKIIDEAHISINLPASNPSAKEDISEPPIKVKIRREAYFIENSLMDLKEIEGFLLHQKSILQDKLKIDIFIAKEAIQQEIIDFINLCKKHKINNFNILSLK